MMVAYPNAKTQIYLSENIRRTIKAHAAATGLTMGEVVEQILQEYYQDNKLAAIMERTVRKGE